MYVVYTKGEDELPPVLYCDDMAGDGKWYNLYEIDPNTKEAKVVYKIREENIMYIEILDEGADA